MTGRKVSRDFPGQTTLAPFLEEVSTVRDLVSPLLSYLYLSDLVLSLLCCNQTLSLVFSGYYIQKLHIYLYMQVLSFKKGLLGRDIEGSTMQVLGTFPYHLFLWFSSATVMRCRVVS